MGMQPDVMLRSLGFGDCLTSGLTAPSGIKTCGRVIIATIKYSLYISTYLQLVTRADLLKSRSQRQARAITSQKSHRCQQPACAPIRGAYSYRPGEGSAKPVDGAIEEIAAQCNHSRTARGHRPHIHIDPPSAPGR